MITLHTATATDFSTLGLGALTPTECTVSEESGGAYELQLRQPVDNTLRHAELKQFRIIKVPVPARETPLLSETDQTTETVQVEREIYRVSVRSRLRLRAKPSTSSKIINSYKNGTRVIVLEKTNDSWYKVSIENGGASGYMSTQYLRYVETKTDTITTTVDTPGKVVNVMQSREQLFRIESVEADTRENVVIVNAKHISYDVSGAIVNATYEPENVAASEVCRQLVSKLDHDISPFEIYCNIDTKISGDYSGKNLLECLLDSENGVAAKCKARVFRDNYTIYILPDETRDLGMQIRYGKNLLSASMTTDTSDIITRIKPVGKNKDGEDLYIKENNGFVDSEHINEYPVIYAKKIDYDVTVGDKLSTSAAMKKLKELADEDFKNGIDAPKISLNSDFVRLELTEKYKALANAYSLHIYDSARVVADDYSINVLVRMVKYTFDCIQQRYTKTELGDITETSAAVYGYEIARGSLDGNRLVSNTVNGDKLRNLSVEYAKFSNATIERLAADAIVAIRADIHEIVAGQITTDQLYADLAAIAIAELTTANIQNANIDWAQIKNLTAEIARITDAEIKTATITAAQIQDLNATVASIADARIQNATITTAQIQDLNAKVAEIVFLTASTGEFDLATIKNLLSNALVLEEGQAGSMMITNLAVTSANLLNATVGKLVIKGEDGNYYAVMVGSDGVIHTQPVEVTEDEIAAGETDSGMQIVEETINAQSINGQTIKAQEALFNTVLTAALNAGKITANDAMLASATIPMLYATAIKALGNTLDISANESIQLIVGEVEAAKVYDSAEPPSDTPEAGKLWLDRGVTPSVMRRWRGVDVPTGRDFETTIEGNPLIVSNIGQVSEIAVQAKCIAQQAGSGESSPENIRPISGRESVTVRGGGKNLFRRMKDYSSSGVTVTVAENGKVTVAGTAPDYTWVCDAYGAYNSTAPLFTAAEDTPVTLSGGTAGVNVAVQYITASGVRSTQYTQGQSKKTFTLPAGASLVRQYIRIPANTVVNGEIVSPQMELGSTATEYEPYRDLGGGEIAPASPLYGLAGAADTVEIMADGSVQAVHRTGVVVIDGDQYVPYDSAYAVPEGVYAYTCPLFNTDAPPIEDFKGLCSHFRIIPHNAAKSERVAGTAALGTSSPQWGQIWFFAAQPTAAEFNAWLAAQAEAGAPVTLAYERAAPQVEKLEAVEPITPQKGDNVLFTDADRLSASLYGSGWETVNDTEDIREGVSENADALYSLSSEFTQTREAFEFRLNQTVNREEQSQYMRYGDGRLELGQSNSRYTAEISPEGGFVVKQEGAEMASMRKNTVSAPVLEARRLIQMGGNTIKLSTSGGLIFN